MFIRNSQNRLDGQGISSLLHTYWFAKHNDKEFISFLASKIKERMKQFRGDMLCRMVFQFADFKYYNEQLLDEILQELYAIVNSESERQVPMQDKVQFLFGLAKLKYQFESFNCEQNVSASNLFGELNSHETQNDHQTSLNLSDDYSQTSIIQDRQVSSFQNENQIENVLPKFSLNNQQDGTQFEQVNGCKSYSQTTYDTNLNATKNKNNEEELFNDNDYNDNQEEDLDEDDEDQDEGEDDEDVSCADLVCDFVSDVINDSRIARLNWKYLIRLGFAAKYFGFSNQEEFWVHFREVLEEQSLDELDSELKSCLAQIVWDEKFDGSVLSTLRDRVPL
eukprot:TRINITY_DN9586_c0_g1_i3.p2 TRINITY_DN9586_c0_g1~~TRINITY_DN9586_c0_g1_i3.p2  ORF type:complete len:346 (+),score=53.56 TRINITY_DN9586_c0_g1_i3:31-1038(+)